MLKDKVLPCPYINPKLFYDIARLPLKVKTYESKNSNLKFISKLHPINVRTTSRSSIISIRCVGYSFLVTTGSGAGCLSHAEREGASGTLSSSVVRCSRRWGGAWRRKSRRLATSHTVSEKAQNVGGEFIHPIVRTKGMAMRGGRSPYWGSTMASFMQCSGRKCRR